MNQQAESREFRFARDVSAYAPKPGHHLVTASFQLGDEACLLYAIEGPANNSMSFRGMAMSSRGIRLFRYSVHGSLVDQLKEIHHVPQGLELVVRFPTVGDGERSRFDVSEALIAFSSVQAPNRVDADAAIASVKIHGQAGPSGEPPAPLYVWFTNHSRGWIWGLVIILCLISIQFVAEVPEEGAVLDRAVEVDVPGGFAPFRINGQLQFQSTIAAAPWFPPPPQVNQ